MPHFICPNCGDRSVSGERTAGFRNQARGCARCGYGFLFELLDDYYPSPNAAFVVFNQDIGISVIGGVYPTTAGQPEAWKESGGFAGTFSPNAAFVVCDQEARVISCGKGVRELTGLGDNDTIGRPVREVLGLEFQNGDDHIGTALEWGVRVMEKPVVVHAEGDRPEPAMADIFPAYDEDGGLLLVLTPKP